MATQANTIGSSGSPLTAREEDYGPDNPQTMVRILVDTAYVATTAAANNGQVSNGVYMLDNRASNGSLYEGSLELRTFAHLEDFVGWRIEPVDPTTQDTVRIIGFEVLGTADAFTSAGEPVMRDTNGQFFVGQVLNAATCGYRIKAELTANGLQVMRIPFYWDPSIVAN
ncbi:hypothetical protein CAL12_27370 [Bordetella genomosp. 8]|uniref:Inclusion body protein n=1 Tax=Bordetella genomosp. 8 TaxID=1416806 RepID=A0A1W6YST5_9BORD|nr:hypothetical protein [Bordetella genomosp. 8]ARP84166.1 hypothetical protein CAL12_27370 [Bordetella genomosp. 8]